MNLPHIRLNKLNPSYGGLKFLALIQQSAGNQTERYNFDALKEEEWTE